MPDERDDRLYAASLLNRADVTFDARDLDVVEKVIALVEADERALIARYLRHMAELCPNDAKELYVISGYVELKFHHDPERNPEASAS